jgi:116 kDa U5 small nuclear ribonucleoprotein component
MPYKEGIKITLSVNKIDRLVLELGIKPADAFYKIKHTIEEICKLISSGMLRSSRSIQS